ncbi:MAG: hypothetical protein IPK27_12915 [Rhodanobacteraceae bacterium]|nr:hypothetical protein [Rhodanobacteraceae bacterium]
MRACRRVRVRRRQPALCAPGAHPGSLAARVPRAVPDDVRPCRSLHRVLRARARSACARRAPRLICAKPLAQEQVRRPAARQDRAWVRAAALHRHGRHRRLPFRGDRLSRDHRDRARRRRCAYRRSYTRRPARRSPTSTGCRGWSPQCSPSRPTRPWSARSRWRGRRAPWLLDDLTRLDLVRRLEQTYPTLEQAGCKVGIGVATGCDRVFIGPLNELPVEASRKLPLVMARDLIDGQIRWGGKGVVNPFRDEGGVVDLADYPQLSAYFHQHYQAVAGRHVATRNGDAWYRTIDRIYPDLMQQPKLLVPDIKGEATFVLDEGHYYPHHNLYYVTSTQWDLRALQAVLRSSVTVLLVATYCTRMAGGFLRFQAQYLRRIRIPHWHDVPPPLRDELVQAACAKDQQAIDEPVFRLYGLSPEDAERTRQMAAQAQVTAKRRNRRE